MTKGDKIIFFSVLILSLFMILFSPGFLSKNVGKTVVIEVDGEIYGKYDFVAQKKPNVLEIKTKYGYNKVVIENDGVYVLKSDCPDEIEIKQGKIKNAGEMLVCLPNRLVIKIEGESEVDFFAY